MKNFRNFLNGESCRLYYATDTTVTPCLCVVLTTEEARIRGYYPHFRGTGIIRLSESKKNPMRQVSFNNSLTQISLTNDDLSKTYITNEWWGKEHGRLYCNVNDACAYTIDGLRKNKQNINKKIFEYQKLMNTVEDEKTTNF